MKTCSRCKQNKELSEFSKDSSTKDGLRANCRICNRAYWKTYGATHRDVLKARSKARRLKSPEKVRTEFRKSYLKTQYGLTAAGHDAIRERQGNKCGCCGDVFRPERNQVAVDHCHKTGVVRGLLCSRCNLGLGHFLDSSLRLRLAAGYLDRFSYLEVLF